MKEEVTQVLVAELELLVAKFFSEFLVAFQDFNSRAEEGDRAIASF